jgi:predicted MFS family arabinose efflux permease
VLTLDVVSLNLSVMIGGAAGGALLAWFGAPGAYIAIVAIYAVGLLAQFLARPPRSQAKARAESPLASLRAGARYAAGSRVLLATLLITVGTNLLGFPYKQLLPVFARDELRVGPDGLGVLAAADGVGALVATLGIAAMKQVPWKGVVYLGGAFLIGSALLLFSFSHEFLISLPLLALLGMGMAGFQTMQSGIMLLASPPEMRGRMMGILSVAIGSFPLGIMALGAFASLIGPLEAVRIMGVLQVLLVCGTVLLAPQLRRF